MISASHQSFWRFKLWGDGDWETLIPALFSHPILPLTEARGHCRSVGEPAVQSEAQMRSWAPTSLYRHARFPTATGSQDMPSSILDPQNCGQEQKRSDELPSKESLASASGSGGRAPFAGWRLVWPPTSAPVIIVFQRKMVGAAKKARKEPWTAPVHPADIPMGSVNDTRVIPPLSIGDIMIRVIAATADRQLGLCRCSCLLLPLPHPYAIPPPGCAWPSRGAVGGQVRVNANRLEGRRGLTRERGNRSMATPCTFSEASLGPCGPLVVMSVLVHCHHTPH